MSLDSYSDLLSPKIIQPLKKDMTAPAGFNDNSSTTTTTSKSKGTTTNTTTTTNGNKQNHVDVEQLKSKKIWEIATGPAKSIPMNLIMSYMTGNSLQLIPIMMTVMLFINPIKAIFNDTNKIFKSLETDKNGSLIMQAKLVYILCQLGCMGIGIWKLNKMGLIPNSDADWLSFKELPVINHKLRSIM